MKSVFVNELLGASGWGYAHRGCLAHLCPGPSLGPVLGALMSKESCRTLGHLHIVGMLF